MTTRWIIPSDDACLTTADVEHIGNVIAGLKAEAEQAKRMVWLLVRACQRNEASGINIPADLIEGFRPERSVMEFWSDPVADGLTVRALLDEGAEK